MPFLTKHLSAFLGHALIDRAVVERQSAKFGAPCRTFSTNPFTEQSCPGSNYDGRRAELPGGRLENRGMTTGKFDELPGHLWEVATAEISATESAAVCQNLLTTKATLRMVDDHAGGLHMGVDNRRPDELEAAPLEIFTQGVRLAAGGRIIFQGFKAIDDRLAANEAPDVRVTTAELFLNLQELARIVHRGVDFQAIANDAGIIQQRFDLFLAVTRDSCRIETGKRFAVSFPLAQHGVPAQSRLGGFQSEKLKDHAIVMHRHAPLAIMILDIIRLGHVDPGATTAIAVIFHK